NDLRRRGEPVVLVAQSNIFTKKLSDPAVRFLTACLFRWWGNGLQMRERYHVARGLEAVGSSGWEDTAHWVGRGEYEITLLDWTRHGRYLALADDEQALWHPRWERRLFESVSLTYDQMSDALDQLAKDGGGPGLEDIRNLCKAVPQRQPSDRRTSEYAE